MTAERICGQHPAVSSGHLISISVAALALVLSAPSECQTNRGSSLADPVSNSTPLQFSHAVHLIGLQHINGATFASATLLASPVSAQQEQQSQQKEASPAGAVAQGQSKTTDKDRPNQNAQRNSQSGTSNDRLFKLLPNFLTLENAGDLPPLTTGEKFKVVGRSSFDYVQLPWYGFLAGMSQAENSEPGYGQGATGYGKRYGAYFADGTIENFMTGQFFHSCCGRIPAFTSRVTVDSCIA